MNDILPNRGKPAPKKGKKGKNLERSANALRENLKKRKAQTRAQKIRLQIDHNVSQFGSEESDRD
ncbi:MAG: hypothetical protein ACJZ9F_04165 [Rhodospirillaceae bacterium]